MSNSRDLEAGLALQRLRQSMRISNILESALSADFNYERQKSRRKKFSRGVFLPNLRDADLVISEWFYLKELSWIRYHAQRLSDFKSRGVSLSSPRSDPYNIRQKYEFFGERFSGLTKVMYGGPTLLRTWILRALHEYDVHRRNFILSRDADAIYTSLSLSPDAQNINSFIPLARVPIIEFHPCEDPRASSLETIVVPYLTPVNTKVLMDQYDVDPNVLETHLRRPFSHGRPPNEPTEGLCMHSDNGTLSFVCEGDIWCRLAERQEIPFLFSQFDPGAFGQEISGEYASPWPSYLSFSPLQGREQGDNLRIESKITIHVWKDYWGNQKVLLLLTPWNVILKKMTYYLEETYGFVRSSKFNKDDVPQSHADPFFVIECGYNTGTRWSVAHMDDEPLIASDKCLLITQRSETWHDHWAFLEEEYARLGEEILGVCRSAGDADDSAVLVAILLHIWPRISRAVKKTLERDRARFEHFKTVASYLMANEFHVSVGSPTDKLLIDALQFFQNRLTSHLSTLDVFEQKLGVCVANVSNVNTFNKNLEVQDEIQRLKSVVQGLQQACADQRYIFTLREQRILNLKQLEEAQKSIQQNNMIRKLTILAFFFIPVSAVTSAFGMNLAEISERQPRIGTFLGALFGVTVVSILLACMSVIREIDDGIKTSLRQAPDFAHPRKLVFLYRFVITGLPRIVAIVLWEIYLSIETLRTRGKSERPRREKYRAKEEAKTQEKLEKAKTQQELDEMRKMLEEKSALMKDLEQLRKERLQMEEDAKAHSRTHMKQRVRSHQATTEAESA